MPANNRKQRAAGGGGLKRPCMRPDEFDGSNGDFFQIGSAGSNLGRAGVRRQPFVGCLTAPVRNVPGCLNQYAFELEIDFQYNPHRTLLERELWLPGNISSANRYSHPRDLALEFLEAEGSQ